MSHEQINYTLRIGFIVERKNSSQIVSQLKNIRAKQIFLLILIIILKFHSNDEKFNVGSISDGNPRVFHQFN